MRYAFGIAVLWVGIAASYVRGAEEEEAVTVFDRVNPSVVGIESVASSGTGVLLDAKGTILTNAHVVALQLPLKCLVDVRKGTKYETSTFRKVTVLGIHPKLDLALIKIDPTENPGTLTPAAINKTPPKTGQRVYAIGNPGARGRVKLTKTVTSGILSGVDRLIEDVSYLQFSAPINPGNSGGPLCDKTGKIIGLVTMKLPDLDNVGFAIPLQTTKADEFKPLKERVKDAAKASKLIAAGNEYINKLNSLRRRGASDSPQALIFRLLALDSMHEALLEDPTNGSIYMSIGDLADDFDEPEVAEEYYRAGISASPWWRDPRIYRSYGRHKLKVKKPDEAEAIWWEGVARHPHLAGLIWEDLAILYRDKQEHAKAATCAAVAAMLKSPGSRPDVALKIGDQSINKITDPFEKAQALEGVAGMAEEMFRRVWQRNILLTQQRPHVTKAFGEYAQRIGLKLDGTLTAAAKPFVIPGFEQRCTNISTASNLAQPGLGTAWTKQGNGIVSPPTGSCRLDGPATIPEEYDLLLAAERLAGESEIVVGFVHQGQPAAVILDFGGNKSGFAGLKSPLHREAVFPKGEFVSLLVQVRKKKVTVRAQEKEILSVSLEGKLPTPPEKWGSLDASKLFVATQDSTLAIYGWQLVKLSPPVPLPPAGAPGAATASNSPGSSNPAGSPGVGSNTAGLAEIASLQDTSWGFKCLALSPNGRFVAGGRIDEAIWIFDVDKNQKAGAVSQLDKLGQVTAIAFTPDGNRLIAGGRRGIVQTWEFKDGMMLPAKSFVGHSQEILTLSCSSNGKSVLSGDRDGRIRYWDLETCREQQVWADFKFGVKAVRFLAGDEALATDGEVLARLNLKTGDVAKTKLPSGNHVSESAAFTADGQWLAAGNGTKVHVWSTQNGSQVVRTMAEETSSNMIWGVGFSPDGKTLLTGTTGKVILWNLESGTRLDEARLGTAGYVHTFSVSADGKRLTSVVSTTGKPLKVFQMPAAK